MENKRKRLARTFNPDNVPEFQRLAAKTWELLRRNGSFRQDVDNFCALDKRAMEETAKYIEFAALYNQTINERDGSRLSHIEQHYNSVKDRPLRNETFNFIGQLRQTHPLAATTLMWLVPDPKFTIVCEHNGRVREGRGTSPRLDDPSWLWKDVYDGKGRRIPKVGGESWVRGPEISASSLTSPFTDWQNWRPGKGLFDCTTPWNKLPKSFKSRFLKEFKSNYDAQAAYEFHYVSPPRQSDNLKVEDAARYLEFFETVTQHRLFAISPTILTSKDVGKVFLKLQNQIKKGLPQSREHFFGSAAAWGHYLAIKEGKVSLARHIVGSKHHAVDATEITEIVRNNRKNVQAGVKAVEKLIALVYPVFDLKKAVLVHSSPPRNNDKRRK